MLDTRFVVACIERLVLLCIHKKTEVVMSTLFGLLAMLCIICILLGLIKPSLVLRWGQKRTRLRAAGWYFFFFLLCVVGGVSTNPQKGASEQPPAGQEAAAAPVAAAPASPAPAAAAKVEQNEPSSASSVKKNDNGAIDIDLGDGESNAPSQKEVTPSDKVFDFNIKAFIKRSMLRQRSWIKLLS